MSVLDDMTSAVNRGTAAANRKAEQLKIKTRMAELSRQRRDLTARLGADLFDVVRQTPSLRERCGGTVAEIEAVDREREGCELRLREIEEEALAARAGANVVRCAKCGGPMRPDDKFCGTCGAPASEARPEKVSVEVTRTSGFVCPKCGAPVEEGDAFCMECGAPIPAETYEVKEEIVIETSVPDDDPERVHETEAAVDAAAEAIEGAAEDAVAEEVVAELVCKACGAPYEEGQRFCMECGAAIE